MKRAQIKQIINQVVQAPLKDGQATSREDIGEIIATLALAHGGLSEEELQRVYPYSPKTSHSIRAKPSLEEIVFAFEWLRGRADDSSVGMHYTPMRFAKRAIACALESRPLNPGDKILDPSCGAGIFFAAISETAGVGIDYFDRLYGFDIDQGAVEVARLVVQLSATRVIEGIEQRIVCADALTELGRERFEIIVGNPPWVSFSGRHAATISPEYAAFLRKNFECFGSGWPTLHGPFLEASAKALAPGGVLALILPQQIEELEKFQGLRDILSQELQSPTSSEALPEKAFAGVSTRSIYFTGMKDSPSRSRKASISTSLRDKTLEHLRSLPRVPDSAFGDIGVHSGNAAKILFNSEGKGTPLHVGADISMEGMNAPTLFVDQRHAEDLTSHFYFRLGDIGRQQSVPVLIRQTASRVIAAANTHQAGFRNSCLAGFGIEGIEIQHFINWLNSDVVSWFYRESFPEAKQRAFPQIKVRALRSLPLPRKWEAFANKGSEEEAFGLSPSALDLIRENLLNPT